MTADKPQIVPLTPNSSTSTVGSGDELNTTTVVFKLRELDCVQAVVSTASPAWVFAQDYAKCWPVTLKQGLTVTYVSYGGDAYSVFLSGMIMDTGQECPFEGKKIYSYPEPEAAADSADTA